MSWWKIAWRSIQQRGLASVLTGFSMALGVMLVVMVLTIHGVVAENFKSGSSVGYNLIIGARGGSLQLVLNTVFYLSQPVENIPYEYYLAFKDKSERGPQIRHSFAFQAEVCRNQTQQINQQVLAALPGGGSLALLQEMMAAPENDFVLYDMYVEEDGPFSFEAKMAIPMCLGDTYGQDSRFRVVATTPEFFTELEIDVESGEHLPFAQGRAFDTWNSENGVFEAVVGMNVAEAENLKLGDDIFPIHGDINTGGHLHSTPFKLVGILDFSGTRNDAAVFVNMEGFFQMDDHIKPVKDEGIKPIRERRNIKPVDDSDFDAKLDAELNARQQAAAGLTEPITEANDEPQSGASVNADRSSQEETRSSQIIFDPGTESAIADLLESVPASASDDESWAMENGTDTGEAGAKTGEAGAKTGEAGAKALEGGAALSNEPAQNTQANATGGASGVPSVDPAMAGSEGRPALYIAPLPIEQREVTAMLLRSYDETGGSLILLESAINGGQMAKELEWSPFRNDLTQSSAQAVQPIAEIYKLFDIFVTPGQMVLLVLTFMICIVSGIGIMVSIYNSMSERKQEIAVMRALGADQWTIMGIILAESVILALGGGLMGWIAAHVVNGILGPQIRGLTGVSLDFYSFAPGISFSWPFSVELSAELLLVPALIFLAIIVGLLPAIAAYRTDVSENLS